MFNFFEEFEKLEVEKSIEKSKKYFNQSEYKFLNGYKSFIPGIGLIYELIFNSKDTKTIQSFILTRQLGSYQIKLHETFNTASFFKKINILISIRENFQNFSLINFYKYIAGLSEFIESVNILFIYYSNFNQSIPHLNIQGIKFRISSLMINEQKLFHNENFVMLNTLRYFSKTVSKNALLVFMPTNVKFGKEALRKFVIFTKIEKTVYYPITNRIMSSKIDCDLKFDECFLNFKRKDIFSFFNLDFIQNDNEKIQSPYELFAKSKLTILKVADKDLKRE